MGYWPSNPGKLKTHTGRAMNRKAYGAASLKKVGGYIPSGHYGQIPLDCIERVGAFKDLKLGARDVWMKLWVVYVPPKGYECRSHLCRLAGLTWDELRKNTAALVDAGLLQVNVNTYTVILPELTKRGKEKSTEPTELAAEVEPAVVDEEKQFEVRIAEIPEDQSTEVPTEAIDLIEELRQQANASDDDERYISSIHSFRSTGQKACGLTREQAQPLWKAYSLEVCKIWGVTEGELQPAVMAEPEPVAELEPEVEPVPEPAPEAWAADMRAFNARRKKVGLTELGMFLFFKAERGDRESIEHLNRLKRELELKENPPPNPEPKPVAEEVKAEPVIDAYDEHEEW